MAEASLPPDYFGKLNKKIAEITEAVFNGTKTGGVFQIIGELLTNTVRESYEDIGIDYTTPDAEMLTRLTRDVWQFSAAKNFNEMRDITLALKDEKGKIREFADFKEKVQGISDKYNETWLRTEYNLSIASSQSAARWIQFEKDANDIPYLMYQTVGDDAVRQSHRELDGIVRKINDVFWNSYYPPNGYGCRCEAVQAPGVDQDQKTIPLNTPVPELFRTNLAKTGLIFPKGHPYYKDIPKAELRKAIAYLPPKNSFIPVVIGDHEINIHPLHGDKELSKNIDAVNTLLKHKANAHIQLMPIIKKDDKAARKNFFGKEYLKKFPDKNPDIKYNGKIAEIETPTGSNTSIKNRIRDGKEQSEFIIIHLSDNADMNEAYRAANGQMNHYKNKADLTVWLVNSNELIELKTKQKGQ